jgi:hypothetical protein
LALRQAVDALERDGSGRTSGEGCNRLTDRIAAGDDDPEQGRRDEAECESTPSHRHAPRVSNPQQGSVRTIPGRV